VEIRFCNDCGKRITESEPADGVKQLCVTCLANAKALQAPVSAPISPEKNTAVLSRRSTAQIRPARPTERVGSGLSPATRKPVIGTAVAIAITVGALLGVVGFFLISGSPNEKEKDKETRGNEKSVAKTEPPAPRQQPVAAPLPTPAPPTQPAAPLPSVMRSSEPAAGAAHELTPKEAYELRLKRGEIKPAATPDTPVAEKDIPASNEAWKDLFNGKDMDGFRILIGNWKVEDGALTATPSGSNSRLQTTAEYGDFELKFKVQMVGYSELQLREYNQVYAIQGANVWKEVSVKAFGLTTTATMDGVALSQVADAAKTGTTGVIGFYASKGSAMKIKDISLRPLKR